MNLEARNALQGQRSGDGSRRNAGGVGSAGSLGLVFDIVVVEVKVVFQSRDTIQGIFRRVLLRHDLSNTFLV
jgi:hypothetical protein